MLCKVVCFMLNKLWGIMEVYIICLGVIYLFLVGEFKLNYLLFMI